MNIVYWLEFTQRIKYKTPPYYYIGSKHNCYIDKGVIIDNKFSSRREYWSSSELPEMIQALKDERPLVRVLSVCDDVLSEEEWYHTHYNIPKSELFFNKAKAFGKFGGSGKNLLDMV